MPTYVCCKTKDFVVHMVKKFDCSLQARNVINAYIYDHYVKHFKLSLHFPLIDISEECNSKLLIFFFLEL